MAKFYQKDSKPKTIGIDARFYGEAGPGRYVKNILSGLEKLDDKNEYYVFLREKGFEAYIPGRQNFKKVLAHHTWYSFDEQIFFLFKLLRYKLDILYVPHFNIPVLYPRKIITAIPDIIMHTFSTEAGTTLPKPYFKIKKLVYRFVLYWAVRRSKKIIVPSKDVILDFNKVYPKVPVSKFVLAYEGVDPDLVAKKTVTLENENNILSGFGIKKPFLLYVSSLYEHKNVYRLFEAFKLLQDVYGFDGNLVLVGKNDTYAQKAWDFIQSDDKLQGKVIMPGLTKYVSDDEITLLREQALVYVFPSLKEGFSLTPLEAQVMGLCCVISDIGVHKEIYGDSVLYFDPMDVSEMAKVINVAITNDSVRKDLIEKGYKCVSKYDWSKTAQITLDVFNNC